MKKLAIVGLAIVAACSTQKPTRGSLPEGAEVLATFTGEVDTEKGTFTIRTEPAPTGSPGQRRSGAVIPESPTTVVISNTGTVPNVDVWNNHASPTGACGGALVTGAKVVVTQMYPSPNFLGAVYAEITSITSGTGVSACNSAAAPAGLDDIWGLWSYGDLTWTPSGLRNPNSFTTEWNFLTGTSAPFSFSGRIVAVKGTANAAFTSSVWSLHSWGDTGTQMVVAKDATRLQFVNYDGTLAGTSAALNANGYSIAVDANRIWFSTDGASGTFLSYVGYMAKDGATITQQVLADARTWPSVVAIIADPFVSGRAWYLARSYNYFRSIDVGSPPTLGTQRSFAAGCAPFDMVFGANGNLFATCQGGTTILEYNTSGALQNTFTIPTECQGANAIIARGSTFWFTAGSGQAVCTMLPTGANAATFTKIASVSGFPGGLAVGPDGNVWVTDGTNKALVRVTAAGDAAYSVNLPATNPNTSPSIGVSSAALFNASPGGLFRLEP